MALVRYIKEVERGNEKIQTHWAATVIFKYTASPMGEKDRATNPLGFQVLEYRNDADALMQDDTAPKKAVQPIKIQYNGTVEMQNQLPSQQPKSQ